MIDPESDFTLQRQHLDEAAHEHDYSDIGELFFDEPELFDRIAREYRDSHPVE